MAEQSIPRLRTSGVIAQELGVPLHRLEYVLRTRAIQPAARAGTLRLYDRKAVAAARYELNLMDAKRAGKGVFS